MARSHGRIIESTFRPHPLLRHAHLQTLVPALLRPLPALAIRRERLELPDGDFVDLGWSGEHHEDGPLAILVHGLTGGFESKYIRGLASRLIVQGWRTVMLQLRGGGEEPNRVARSYHQGDTADLRHLWHLLRQREPHTRLAVVGWSLGGNIVLKALGEEAEAAPVDIAAAASVPFRLHECADRLRTGFSRVYQGKLLRELKAMVLRKHALTPLPASVNLQATLAAQDFYEFDNAFICPLNGFRDADDYYTRAACGSSLHAIRRPTLIVHALDDPFMDASIIPTASQMAPPVTLELTQQGGHVGFVAAGPAGQPHWWLERRLAEFLTTSVPPP